MSLAIEMMANGILHYQKKIDALNQKKPVAISEVLKQLNDDLYDLQETLQSQTNDISEADPKEKEGLISETRFGMDFNGRFYAIDVAYSLFPLFPLQELLRYPSEKGNPIDRYDENNELVKNLGDILHHLEKAAQWGLCSLREPASDLTPVSDFIGDVHPDYKGI